MRIKIPLHQKIWGSINKNELNKVYIELLDMKYNMTIEQYHYYLRMIYRKYKALGS
jgi:hypothetical protein